MKHVAHRKTGYWEYRGYALEKSEGCSSYNVYKIKEDGNVNWYHTVCYAGSFKEAKLTVDIMVEE